MNLQEIINKNKKLGYSDENSEAKVCQDIILYGLSRSSLSKNATIKGGVVMRSISNNIRRATQDIDIDFVKYSLNDEAIKTFINKINNIKGIKIYITGKIKELKQQDYKGKRVLIRIEDETGYSIKSKIDLGVHKDADIKQDEYCFDISFDDKGASLLINSKEQMIVEKLKSILRFRTLSTRYKDIFDIYYLLKTVDKKKLTKLLDKSIYKSKEISESSNIDLAKSLEEIYLDKDYLVNIKKSKCNWIEKKEELIINEIIKYFNN